MRHLTDTRLAVFVLALAIAISIVLKATGCAVPLESRRRSAEKLLRAWSKHKRSVVPHPSYGPKEVDEVKKNEAALEAALFDLADAEGAEIEEEQPR